MATSLDQGNANLYGALTGVVTVNGGTPVIKATPGRLARVVITTAGTSSITFFDSAAAASGRVLFITPATTTLGQIFDVQMPAINGIVASAGASSAAATVSFT